MTEPPLLLPAAVSTADPVHHGGIAEAGSSQQLCQSLYVGVSRECAAQVNNVKCLLLLLLLMPGNCQVSISCT
jgi:hypothetical protein